MQMEECDLVWQGRSLSLESSIDSPSISYDCFFTLRVQHPRSLTASGGRRCQMCGWRHDCERALIGWAVSSGRSQPFTTSHFCRPLARQAATEFCPSRPHVSWRSAVLDPTCNINIYLHIYVNLAIYKYNIFTRYFSVAKIIKFSLQSPYPFSLSLSLSSGSNRV